MGIKKPQTKTALPAKPAKVTAGKAAGAARTRPRTAAKKISPSKPGRETGVAAQKTAPAPSITIRKKTVPGAPLKKTGGRNTAKAAQKKSGTAGPRETAKKALRSPAGTAGPERKSAAEVKSGTQEKKRPKAASIEKTASGKVPSKQRGTTSAKILAAKKTAGKEPVKAIRVKTSVTPGEKPGKRSDEMVVAAKARVTRKKTVTSSAAAKPLSRDVGKGVIDNTGGKVIHKVKVAAKVAARSSSARKSTGHKEIPAAAEVSPRKAARPLTKTDASHDRSRKIALKKKEAGTSKKIKAAVKTGGSARQEKKVNALKATIASQKESRVKKPVAAKKKRDSGKAALKPKRAAAITPSGFRKKIGKSAEATSALISAGPPSAVTGQPPARHIYRPQEEKKHNIAAQLKIFLPEEEIPPEADRAPSPQLPEEYGENELLLMEVDPSIVFVSWEIKPEDISGEAGTLTLRVYDVTGADFEVSRASRFFDVPLSRRVDSKFYDIKMPGRDVIMEVGLLQQDHTFMPLKRSNRVTMPELQNFQEPGITASFTDASQLIGY